MKCDSLSLKKYIDKSPKVFFVYGEEIVLQNYAKDLINDFFKKNGFDGKKIITKKDFPNINKILLENAGGSLFGSSGIRNVLGSAREVCTNASALAQTDVLTPARHQAPSMVSLRPRIYSVMKPQAPSSVHHITLPRLPEA